MTLHGRGLVCRCGGLTLVACRGAAATIVTVPCMQGVAGLLAWLLCYAGCMFTTTCHPSPVECDGPIHGTQWQGGVWWCLQCGAYGGKPGQPSEVQLAKAVWGPPLCCPARPTHHVRAPLLQVEPAVDHRAYARVLLEAIRGGNHSLARVLISGASLDTLLMSDTQGRGFLHALGRVQLATSMLIRFACGTA